MFRVLSLVACLSAGTALLGGVASGHAQPLKVGGTGSANELIISVGKAWLQEADSVPIEVIPGLGSSGGIAAVADGALDLAISGRKLKDEEKAKGLIAVEFARSPLVFATSHATGRPLNAVDVPNFYAHPTSTWPDKAPVRPILRPKSESDTLLLIALYRGMADALTAMRARQDVPIAATDQDNLDAAERIAGSLVAASLAQIVNEKRNLRVLPIDGVVPTLEASENGSYPFVKSFYLVLKVGADGPARSLLAFLSTAKGVAALRAAAAFPPK